MIQLDTTQSIRTKGTKRITRHNTRVRGPIKKDPAWYGPNIHIVEWNLAQLPVPIGTTPMGHTDKGGK